MKKYIIITAVFFNVITAFAQHESSLLDFEKSRQNINQTAMLVLGSWAVGNILLGTYGNFKTKNETKYFHQFNAMWNTVNLGIAVFGYLNAVDSNPADMTNLEILKDYSSLQNFLLLNAGLDVAYIMTGLYLKEKSKSSARTEMLRGYGNSLLLQGGFLLLFDVALYFIHQNNADVLLYPNLENIFSGGVGIGMNIRI
jgi:hypothetical protein